MAARALRAIGFVLVLMTAACERPLPEPVKTEPAPTATRAPRAQREVFDYAKYPGLTAVGKLELSGGTWCTVALVSEQFAVTAGHCFIVSRVKFNMAKPIPKGLMMVRLKPKGAPPLEDLEVKRIVIASFKPDFAILELNKPVPSDLIRPLTVTAPSIEEMRRMTGELGCAGFNDDKDLGGSGMFLTISRRVEIVDDSTAPERLDTNCFASYGGSGGPFFRQTESKEVELLGVVWGVTDVEYDENGKLVTTEDITTSITMSEVFAGELRKLGIGQ